MNQRTTRHGTLGLVRTGLALLACLSCCTRGCSTGRTSGTREVLPPVPVQYILLRFDLATTSMGAMLTIQEPENVLTGRLVATQGAPFKKGVSMRSVVVARAPQSPSTEEAVSVTVDYALGLGALARPLALRLSKTPSGEATVRVSSVAAGTAQVLGEARHTGPEPLAFEIDLGPLGETQPLTGQVSRAAPTRMVWAFYYPWYADPWNTAVLLDRPAIGYYDSNERGLIETHVEQALDAEVDGFVSSWWGPGDFTDENLRTLLDVAASKGLRVMINFELIEGLGPGNEPIIRPSPEIHAWLRYAALNYGDHPAYMKLDGKPVFVMWASYNVSDDTWAEILADLETEGIAVLLVAETSGDWPHLNPLDVFAGMHIYNILGIVQSAPQIPDRLAPAYSTMGRALRHYGLLVDPPTPKLWAATVEPGYDDHLQGKPTPVLDRDEGCLYRATFEAAAASDPDWIFVTSWNEWWEHTYIEPSVLYGDRYLDLTRDLASKWKRGEPTSSYGSPECD